jgi:carboxymethylenebutenolidase
MTDQRVMPSHVLQMPILATEGKLRFDGFVARPPSGAGPGLLIFSEMWGVTASKTELAESYAQRGWCAMVPTMFWRSEFYGAVPYDQPDRAWERLKAFDWDKAVDDVKTAGQWLRDSPHCTGKVAAIGFCMGGRIAFLAAAHAAADAAVSFYPVGIGQHLDAVRKMAVPLQLHYGLDDEHVPQSEIDAVAEAAKESPNVEIHRYPGAAHGFFTKGRPGYNEGAVAEATARVDRLLETLK